MTLIWRGVNEPYISVKPSAWSGTGGGVTGSVLGSLGKGRGRLKNITCATVNNLDKPMCVGSVT